MGTQKENINQELRIGWGILTSEKEKVFTGKLNETGKWNVDDNINKIYNKIIIYNNIWSYYTCIKYYSYIIHPGVTKIFTIHLYTKKKVL